ncbi:polysaccharide pyruvyl transferase family protein [Vibrio diabolicus]|uniref:polysaccharide pyruvyl transferase family protein n=1 Tax=Vibrio diabolicus TaxID=50719 RepID=UPI002151C9F8|nr:polysaccharide pyruvyl transferase family protein [Vibrio diabolicus]ELB2749054.1 polysaccharide pyruvyl transferase family protein [Vibrio alginolyticus]UDY82929.1 polysaccharide pyruvyl transferase family protein [Vibrio diabolicus]
MIFEVIGIGAPNKGAELMLTALKNKISERYPDAQFVLEPYSNYLDRAPHGVLQKFWFTVRGVQIGFLGNFIPKKFRQKFGIVLDSEIDIIVDASGFAYGDQWGVNKLRQRVTRYLPKWKQEGKKVILLPQAFGPFTKPGFDKELEILFEHADLICARDGESLKYLKASDKKNQGKIIEAPDYTNLCHGVLPPELNRKELDVCFIPNAKMIEMTDSSTGTNYAQSMASLITLAQQHGRKPFILLHEGKKDLELSQEINNLLETKVELLQYQDPLHIKGVIGHANLTVSSRFHGLVSSLSQGKPCIATGWSHKYQMLMDGYGCSEFLVKESSEEARERLSELLDQEKYDLVKEKILTNGKTEKQKAEEAWDKVFSVIG